MSVKLADKLRRSVQLHVPVAAALTCPPFPVSSRQKRGNGQPSLLCLLSLFLGRSQGMVCLASTSRPHTTIRDIQPCPNKFNEYVRCKADLELPWLSFLKVPAPSSSTASLCVHPNESALPRKTSELILLVSVQCIDCRGDILLASDLFCVGVTKHSKIQFAAANPGSWQRDRGGGGASQAQLATRGRPRLPCSCWCRSEQDSPCASFSHSYRCARGEVMKCTPAGQLTFGRNFHSPCSVEEKPKKA